ncbi:MAG: GCN5-related N-acetyltransferase [Bacteroidetes bacterium]|nr:GCN5-related N-acetyltransferase [Bacteroidota bacterium]
MKLVRPSAQYKASFTEAAREIEAEGLGGFLKASYDENDFQKYCDTVNNLAHGIGLAAGNVSETIFWMVDDSDNFIGNVSIRHSLTDHLFIFGGHIGYIIAPRSRGRGYGTLILMLSLPEASALGLDKVLVTCDNTNTASARIIEKNGGIFENEMYSETRKVWKRRYWIDLRQR